MYRKNEQIRVPEIRVIDERGNQLGIMATVDALNQAQEQGLDLVEVSPKATPPVCRIIDFGKMIYEKEKEERKQKAKQKNNDVKCVRLTANIGDHDFETRVNQGLKFLEKNFKVGLELRLKGREKAHPEVAFQVMDKYIKALGAGIVIEQHVKKQGGNFSALVRK